MEELNVLHKVVKLILWAAFRSFLLLVLLLADLLHHLRLFARLHSLRLWRLLLLDLQLFLFVFLDGRFLSYLNNFGLFCPDFGGLFGRLE